MELVSSPTRLDCSACGTAIDGAGYLPATERAGALDPAPESAICDTCGFNEVGMTGCAPTLDEVTQPGQNDVLMYVNVSDEGIDVISTRE